MLLARVANQVYWAGRYLERVEDLSRVVQVHGETHVDLPVGADIGWLPLLGVFGLDDLWEDHLRRQEAAGPSKNFESANEAAVVKLLVTDRDNPSSILSALSAARENLRVARPVVPREAWELINELWHASSASQADAQPRRPSRVVAQNHR